MFSAGRVGGEALGDRGGEARLVDDGEVAGLVISCLSCSPLRGSLLPLNSVQGEGRPGCPGSTRVWSHAPLREK